ncbi:MAG: hypothetical protein KAX05_15570 [Bacteroidales bacterium]|nr:hypothetical protein [Bacteroidales bacterium]
MADPLKRYARGLHQEYDDKFDFLWLDSPILNAEARVKNWAYAFENLNDLGTLQRLLDEFLGKYDVPGKPGRKYYLREKEQKNPFKQDVEDRLAANAAQHQSDVQLAINAGRPEPPETITIRTERLELEAEFDCIQAEIKQIKAWMKKAETKKKEISDKNVLKYGPKGSGSLRGGFLSEIDGMTVSVYNGVLHIDSPGAKYHMMRTCDYITHIVKPWKIALGVMREEQQRNLAMRLRKGEGDARTIKFSSVPPLPEWPANVKPFDPTAKIVEKKTEEKPKPVRTTIIGGNLLRKDAELARVKKEKEELKKEQEKTKK